LACRRTPSVFRLGLDQTEGALLEPHVKVFYITGRSMKGSVLVESESAENNDLVKGWITRAMKLVGKTPRK
jgi:hypothetical protein